MSAGVCGRKPLYAKFGLTALLETKLEKNYMYMECFLCICEKFQSWTKVLPKISLMGSNYLSVSFGLFLWLTFENLWKLGWFGLVTRKIHFVNRIHK